MRAESFEPGGCSAWPTSAPAISVIALPGEPAPGAIVGTMPAGIAPWSAVAKEDAPATGEGVAAGAAAPPTVASEGDGGRSARSIWSMRASASRSDITPGHRPKLARLDYLDEKRMAAGAGGRHVAAPGGCRFGSAGATRRPPFQTVRSR